MLFAIAIFTMSLAQAQTTTSGATAPATEMKKDKGGKHGKHDSDNNMQNRPDGKSDNNGDNGVREDKGEKGEKTKALLGLNDEQNTKFRAIVQERRKAAKAIKGDKSLSEADKKAKLDALNVTRDTQLKAFFTPDQLAKWNNLNKNKGNND